MKGLNDSVENTIKYLSSVNKIYISFDVDSLDSDSVSRGTGTPVIKGLESVEIISIIKELIKTGKIVALEISEINPLLDNKGNVMAEKTFEIIKEVFNT